MGDKPKLSKKEIYKNARNAQGCLGILTLLFLAAIGLCVFKILITFEQELGGFILLLFWIAPLGLVYIFVCVLKYSAAIDVLIEESLTNDLLELVRESQRKFPPE